MKKYIFISLFLILACGVTGCSIDVDTNKAVMIDELTIEEGCYAKENDSEHLICFTKDLSYYDVLYKYDTYYNDPYYSVSPPTEDKSHRYTFVPDDGLFTLTYYQDGEEYLTSICSTPTETTIDCSVIATILGDVEKSESKYTKVDKEFNKEIIEGLPLYERNKEFELNFDGNTFNCNLTRSYSITNSFSGTVISNCLKNNLNKEYSISQISTDGSWQIWPKDLFGPQDNSNKSVQELYKDLLKNYSTQTEQLNYIKENYSYNVTVNGKTFKYTDAFPIDPYSSNERMIVNISKK